MDMALKNDIWRSVALATRMQAISLLDPTIDGIRAAFTALPSRVIGLEGMIVRTVLLPVLLAACTNEIEGMRVVQITATARPDSQDLQGIAGEKCWSVRQSSSGYTSNAEVAFTGNVRTCSSHIILQGP